MIYDENGLKVDSAELEHYGENAARSAKWDSRVRCRDTAATMRRELREIRLCCNRAAEKRARGDSYTVWEEWLTDNFYLASGQGTAAARELENSPAVPGGSDGAAITALCVSYVNAARGAVEPESMERFFSGCQRAVILSSGELNILGAGLSRALIAMLARQCRRNETGETEIKNVFTSLRWLSTADLRPIIRALDKTEAVLLRDPAGVYGQMDEQSQAYYRAKLSKIAAKHGMSEYEAARAALILAQKGRDEKHRHVGWWILHEPMGRTQHSKSGGGYVAVLLLGTLFLSLLPAFAFRNWVLFPLLLLPVSELVKNAVDYILLRTVKPEMIPGLELEKVPEEGRTLCVVSAVVGSRGKARERMKELEKHFLVSRGGRELGFGLLLDMPESGEKDYPGEGKIIVAAAELAEKMKKKYGTEFYVFTRPRHECDGKWSGWERKRGAITELVDIIQGEKSELRCAAGDENWLKGVRFLITLDSDTVMAPNTAKRLVGAMLHPLNRPEWDENGVVRCGYGIISPRTTPELESVNKSEFGRIFAGPGGADPYSGLCGEVYMDMWQLGTYTGKGIIDVEAFYTCLAGKIPEGRVLSHDTIEGAYLHCGYMSDGEVFDGFPSTPGAYYRRAERWTRGDWQNSPWLFFRGRDLSDISCLRLFDSLRRSLVSPAVLVAVCVGLLNQSRGLAIAALAAIISSASEMIICAGERLVSREGKRAYAGRIYSGFTGSAARTFLRLLLLPLDAVNQIRAVLTALWRMLVSGRNLLQWQTAEQSGNMKSNPFTIVRDYWSATLLSAIIIMSTNLVAKVVGILWLLSPIYAWALGIEDRKRPIPSERRSRLMHWAGEIWRYFDRFMTAENHFLPPDNYQEQPPVGLALRTSPTNIGLGLTSCVAAAELGLCSREEAVSKIEGCIETVEKLEKYRGHLLNWYATDTLQHLTPAYVSAVDCGNFVACLICLEGAMRAWGQRKLSKRIQSLEKSMDMSLFYDRERCLFTIGIDPETGEKSKSWYDLFSGEMRLGAYVAVARGQVPPKLWQRLSRAQVQKNGYRGTVSWTGTMFEYLMPELCLPLYKNSQQYESARFCLYVQQERVKGKNLPWGISESAYYSLDPAMNYRYKAHGCGDLAMKRGMDEELVLSPYSSFLALCVDEKAAVDNLLRLQGLGAGCDFGFYEALDCSGDSCDTVKCVMAHHLGMSLGAIANALNGTLQNYFMADAQMSAHRLLLQERVTTGGSVLRRSRDFEPPKNRLSAESDWEERIKSINYIKPRYTLLAGNVYSLMVNERGEQTPKWNGVTPYIPGEGIGVSVVRNGIESSLMPDGGECSAVFSSGSVSFSAKGDSVSISAAKDAPGERRSVSLAAPGVVRMTIEPIIARLGDYEAHPAFCKLGLSAFERDGCLVIRRRERGNMPETFMAIACSRDCDFFSAPGERGGRWLGQRAIDSREHCLVEPILALQTKENVTVADFAVALAGSAEQAIACAKSVLVGNDRGDLGRRAAAVLNMSGEALEMCRKMLTMMAGPTAPAGTDFEKEKLWKFGISGDLPILCAEFSDEKQLARARMLMDCHLWLCACGFDFDMVFITREENSYRTPLEDAMDRLIRRSGGELLRGAKGGIHAAKSADGAQAVVSCAACRVDLDTGLVMEDRRLARSLPTRAEKVCVLPLRQQWKDGKFMFAGHGSLPGRVWSNVLTNGRFSYLACDSGCGNMWFMNARENAITPWRGQPLGTHGPENLTLTVDGREHSLFGGSDSYVVSFEPGCCVWEKQFGTVHSRVTAFVPTDADVRVFIIELEGVQGGALRWRAELQLAPERADARYVDCGSIGDMLVARNRRSKLPDKPFYAMAEPAFSMWSFDGALETTIEAQERVVIVCGCDTPEKIKTLLQPGTAETALQNTVAAWRRGLERVHLSLQNENLHRYMHLWCAYQTLACRIMARGSIYQNGGAYGFRDQLQDSVNLIVLNSDIARNQILRCCAHQYEEGDVQHWWHETSGASRGVRTHCSDDLLWLVWACCEYGEKTGKLDIFREERPFLRSAPLMGTDRDRYEEAPRGETASVAEHCLRALQEIMRRGVGEHGLLLFGSGDWNDGFDKVGGESVWLSWFFVHTAGRFADLSQRFLPDCCRELEEFANGVLNACHSAWDGDWYLRGWYRDGKPLGSSKSRECSIDSIAQSFAVFCTQSDRNRAKLAVNAAFERLFDRENGAVKLFDPPFGGSGERPGYISGYGPGFRENGGQYTHAAVWLASALLQAGETEKGWQIIKALLPGGKLPETYGGEPFVLAADVYSNPDHAGCAGWTWYTGAAGWFYRMVTEELLGLKLRDGRLYVMPNLPEEMPGYEAFFHGRHIVVDGENITVDGEAYDPLGTEIVEI